MMLTRKFFIIIIGLFSILWVMPAYADQNNGPIILKIGSLAPKGIGWSKLAGEILIPAITDMSDGNVHLRIYYGGIMGDDKDVIRKMRQGKADGGGFSGQGSVMACRHLSVLELPFMFQGYDEVDYVREKMFWRFYELVQKVGLYMVFWLDQDFDQFYSSKMPLSKLEHFSQADFMTWYGILEENMLMSLGADPLPVAALQLGPFMRQGKANAMLSPAIWIVGTQLHTRMKYFNPLKIRYSPGTVLLTKEASDRIPAIYWERLHKNRFDVADRFLKATRKDNERCIEAMIKYGVKKIEMEPEEIEKIRKKTMPVWGQMAGKLYSKELLDELVAHLEDYRSTKKK